MQDFYINNVKIDWTQISKFSYLRRIQAISKVKTLRFEKPVTLFSGENGSGKLTLLEAIAKNYGFNEEGGTLNMKFETYNDTSELDKAITLAKEPEAALSPNRQMELLLFINNMVHRGAQFIIVTHYSPILLSFLGADILNFSEEGLKKISYEQTESYRIMELFINHKDSILNNLLKDSQ